MFNYIPHFNIFTKFPTTMAMACTITHHRRCPYHSFIPSNIYCLQNFSISSSSHLKKFNSFVRVRTIRKLSSANRNPSTGAQKSNSKVAEDQVRTPRDPDPDPEPGDLLSTLLHRFREVFKLDGLGVDIMSIALPAALALAADPIASLVDTGFVGHLGSAELAAVGVSGAVFNLVSKLFNVPLLNITTSFVAEEQALAIKAADDDSQTTKDQQRKMCLPSVSTSLVLAAALGVGEAIALSTGSSILMNTIGIPNAHAS